MSVSIGMKSETKEMREIWGSLMTTSDIDNVGNLKKKSFTFMSEASNIRVSSTLSKYLVRELTSIADISLSFSSAHLSKITRN